MTGLVLTLLLMAVPPVTSLEQVKADPNAEHRARAAVDFSAAAQKRAEAAYSAGDLPATLVALKEVLESIELAQTSFVSTGKTPGRSTGIYKYAEQRSAQLLTHLRDLAQKMDDSEREAVEPVRARVQEIHDQWFEGLMGRKK